VAPEGTGYEDVYWIHLAQYSVQWQALVIMLLYLWVP